MNVIFSRAAIPALALGLLATTASLAPAVDATNASAPMPLPKSMLDNDDMTKLKTVRAQVLAAHPEIKAEEEKLTSLHASAQTQTPPPTPEQKNAMFAEWKAYQKTMRAEMLKIDPTLGPIFIKLDEARKNGSSPTPFQPAPAR